MSKTLSQIKGEILAKEHNDPLHYPAHKGLETSKKYCPLCRVGSWKKKVAVMTVEGMGFKKEIKYKIDWEAEARCKQDEIDRLCKLIDRYAIIIVAMVCVIVGVFILGITIGRAV